MKFATWKDGSRDGQLVVVSRDLATGHYAQGRATTLQQVLDDWNFLAPQLQDLALALDSGQARHAFAFDPQRCMAPLPRAYAWAFVDASSGATPRLLPGDDLLGPCDRVPIAAGRPCRIEPALAAVSGDLERGASPEQALEAVRLLTLCAVWHAEPAQTGDGSLQEPPTPLATRFAPVMVTPDELGPAWSRGWLQGDLHRTGETSSATLRAPAAAPPPDLGQTLARLCGHRRLRAGTVVGAAWAEALPLATGNTARACWRLPDGTDPFGALDLGSLAVHEPPRRVRFG